MKIQEEQSKIFTDRLYKSENTDELQQLLLDVNAHAQSGGDFRPRRIRMAIYGALRDNLRADEDKVSVRAMMLELWQLCVTADVDEEERASGIEEVEGREVHTTPRPQEDTWERHEARELLGEWIAAWIEVESSDLRTELCQLSCELALRDDASIETVQAACWTLGEIGWRNEQVEETLWRVLERDDIAGDVASGVLADMGTSEHQRTEFIKQLRARAARRSNRFNGYALQRLGTPELLDDALAFFHRHPEISWYDGKTRGEEGAKLLDRRLRLGFLSQVADSLWEHSKAQNRIWDTIYEYCIDTSGGRNDLMSDGDLVSQCDSPSLVKDFLNTLTAVLGDEGSEEIAVSDSDRVDRHHFTLHIAAERLLKSVRPRQLDGWKNLDAKSLISFERLAVRNTNQSGMFSTSPMRAKESSWQMLAMAGGRWNSNMVEDALRYETSGSSQGDVADVVACFGCQPLPAIVTETLIQRGDGTEGERDISQGEDSSLFIGSRAMENVARGTADRAAFDALLGFNYVYGDDVLRSTNDALNEVAAHLIRSGDTSILSALWEAITPTKPTRQRILAISGLHYLAIEGLLPAENWEQLLDFAEDQNIDSYFRALAIQAVGFLKDDEVKQSAWPKLRQFWLGSGDVTNDELAWSARESLGRHATWLELTSHEQEKFLGELGLEERDGECRVRTNADIIWSETEPEIMRSLFAVYRSAPKQFESAVCDVLSGSNEDASYALSAELLQRGIGEQVRFAEPLTNAIVAQIHRAASGEPQHSRSSVRLYVFDDLSLGAPQRLLEEPWREITDSLPTEARARLADAMGRANAQEADLAEASLTLDTLARDGSFVVRRAALRAAGILIPNELKAWCESWGEKTSSTSQRRIAAQGIFWLHDIPDELKESLSNDQEPTVRESINEGAKAYQQRLWANSYLRRIEAQLPVSQTPNELYAYGVALAETGDDFHLHRLQTQDIEFPNPAMKFWWKQVTKNLQNNWRKAAKDWNDLGEGAISTHDDKALIVVNDEKQEVEAWIWERPRAGIRGTSDWGGRLRVKDNSHVLSADNNGSYLRLSDGRGGQILIGNSNRVMGKNASSQARFHGQGKLEATNAK